MLFVGAEFVDFVHDGGEQIVGREGAVAAQGGGEALFAKLFVRGVEGLGDAVSVEGENVSGRKLDFAYVAIPALESANNSGGGFEARKRIVAPQEQCGKMPTISVTQATRGIVVLGKEQRGKRAVRGVLAKKLVHGTQHTLRLIHGDCALAAKIGLEISHQQRRGDAFAGNVANDEAEPFAA